MLRRMDSYTQALRNLESRLALALNSATQAEHDLNAVRMQAGLPPHKWFHLSAAVVAEAPVGPKTGGVRLSAEQIVNAGRAARGRNPADRRASLMQETPVPQALRMVFREIRVFRPYLGPRFLSVLTQCSYRSYFRYFFYQFQFNPEKTENPAEWLRYKKYFRSGFKMVIL